MNVRVLIGGCRNYTDYASFCPYIDHMLKHLTQQATVIILSGHCRGTDAMAEQYASLHAFPLEIFPAQWQCYGKAAGPIRNQLMVDRADYVIAFWDGHSPGTRHLIECAQQANKPLRVKRIRL